MGGTIGIERTKPGQGSTFFVELPLTEQREHRPGGLLRGPPESHRGA